LSLLEPNTEIFTHYDNGDGLQSNKFNITASFENTARELFFGGESGFNRFFAEEITNDTLSAKVVVSNMLILLCLPWRACEGITSY
jgi:hypothetical protein